MRATDPNGLLADTVVRVLVTDMNDSPTFPDASRIVNENAFATTAVGGVLVVQDEDSLQTHSFAITTGNDAAIFTVDTASGQLSVDRYELSVDPDTGVVTSVLDFESTTQYVLTVTATDHGQPSTPFELADTAPPSPST